MDLVDDVRHLDVCGVVATSSHRGLSRRKLIFFFWTLKEELNLKITVGDLAAVIPVKGIKSFLVLFSTVLQNTLSNESTLFVEDITWSPMFMLPGDPSLPGLWILTTTCGREMMCDVCSGGGPGPASSRVMTRGNHSLNTE